MDLGGRMWGMKRLALFVQAALVVLVALVILTGFGITEHRTVTSLTFGLIDKASAFRLHSVLYIPFLAVLAVHIGLTSWRRLAGRNRK